MMHKLTRGVLRMLRHTHPRLIEAEVHSLIKKACLILEKGTIDLEYISSTYVLLKSSPGTRRAMELEVVLYCIYKDVSLGMGCLDMLNKQPLINSKNGLYSKRSRNLSWLERNFQVWKPEKTQQTHPQFKKQNCKAVCIRQFYGGLSFNYKADMLNKAYVLLVAKDEREKGSWRRIGVGVTYAYGEGY